MIYYINNNTIYIMTDFKELVPSTKTIISVLNINIDIAKVFPLLEITNYVFTESKRGRRPKTEKINNNDNIPDGSIINLEYENEIRGYKKKLKAKTNRKFFRNTLTVEMFVDGKKMNFKIFTAKEGTGNKTQHPGCKDVHQAEKALLFFWEQLNRIENHYSFIKEEELSIIFHTVMTNINFNLGFVVNRQKLNDNINRFSQYNSMLETNIGHAGTNITQPITEKIEINDLPKITLKKDGSIQRDIVTFNDYLDKLPDKQRNLQLNKTRKNTFLVFYSGKTIMSGFVSKYMEDSYYNFIETINEIRDDIEEKNK